MGNGRTPLYLAVLAFTLLAAALLIFQPYSVTSTWGAYTRPARRYLEAAVRSDSQDLVRRSGSSAAVVWALRAARRHPDSLAVWARQARAWTGQRQGDTAEVLLETPTDVCGDAPIWLRFVGSGDEARVLEAGSRCFEERP